jgi:uncharacterized protein (TIGR00730 family)
MTEVKSVCVFCGASNGIAKHFLEEGKRFGGALADKGLRLVYGGADCGIMGAVANGALEKNGLVTGVFPRVLDGLEEAHHGLDETIIVDDMHTRKMTMFDKSDAFVVFPGGFGTMDETFEVITWKQLHTHKKPIVIYNYEHYWDSWVSFTDHIIEHGFATQRTRQLYDVVDTIEGIFGAMGK